MFRNIAILIVGAGVVANLNAGSVQIQIGGNTGLTSTYNVSAQNITTTGGASEAQYIGSAWQGTGGTAAGATAAGALCAGATAGTCVGQAGTSLPSGEPSNEFITSNGVTFAMVDQTISGNAQNLWAAATSGTSSITIPIGIFGVTNVFTMLSDEFGVAGATPTTVTFDFANAAADETFTLVNGTVISDSYDCTTGTCPSYATTLNTTNEYGTNGASLGLIGSSSLPNVTAFNVWNGVYGPANAGAYNGTSGNLYLDAQDFALGSGASNTTLTQIVITDTAGGATKVSRDLLSAITVDATAPEPSTVLLLLAGIGAVGFIRRRQKQQ